MKMKKFLNGILVTLLSFPIIVSAHQNNKVDYTFTKDVNSYSFRGTFIIQAECDRLIDVIFAFEHISKFTASAESVELVRQGENWNEVTYTFRKFFVLENKSTWRRTLKRNEQKIVFEMISSKNNINIMPKALSSEGYYQIRPEGEGCLVEYFQECKLKDGFLRDVYIYQAKKEAIAFLRDLKEYLERTCN